MTVLMLTMVVEAVPVGAQRYVEWPCTMMDLEMMKAILRNGEEGDMKCGIGGVEQR